MKPTLPLLATLALGLALPALAQDAPATPPPAEPAVSDEASAPPPAAPGREQFRRGPRRDGAGPRREGAGPRREGGGPRPEGAGPRGPRPDGAGPRGPRPDGAGPRPDMADGAGRFGMLVPLLRRPETAGQIGLAEDKAAELAETLAEFQEKLQALRAKLPEAMKRQTEALEAAEVDEEAVLAAADDVWDIRRDVALLQTRQIVAIRKALTAEQLAKAEELLRKAWEDAGMRRGGREGRPARRPGARPAPAPAPAAEP